MEAFERAQATRREFLQSLGVAAAGAAVASSGCADVTWESFFQKHYKKLDVREKRDILRRIEQETKARYGVEVGVGDPRALPGVEFGYALNLTTCTGCRQCEYACAAENNTSRDPEMHYIRVLEMEASSFDVERSEHHYEGEVPQPGKFYMPVQCHQCRNPPCVSACPVEATWQEPDGIVVVDYNWCIGCRYCQAACPYDARRFNFAEPSIRPSEINPEQGYLSNRIRPVGVVEKCHFCLHRVRTGRYPACLEACPVGARKFGNLLDPESEVRRILETKRVYVLKEEAGTHPRFYYYFD
ncbi:MAG: 4Fe-4S dicluster domain-containing protein [Deltaproteobacteria bacterium]|nr:4Fe-4S dicluster domain-containing protein [Deltaproteobacteria bacterium]